MFVFLTDRFGGRRVKIPSKITEFTFFWPETGTGRKLGNTLYLTLQRGNKTEMGSATLVNFRAVGGNFQERISVSETLSA